MPRLLLAVLVVGELEEPLRGVGRGVVLVSRLAHRYPAIGFLAFLQASPHVGALIATNPVGQYSERSPARDAKATARGGAGDVLLPVGGGKDGASLALRDIHHFADINVLTLGVIVALGLEIPVVIIREVPNRLCGGVG